MQLNETVAGESGLNALVALAYRVPVVLITGDSTTATEAAPFCPGIEAVVVKDSITRFAAASVHPGFAADLIRGGARRALQRLDSFALPAISLPATLRVRFRNADLAETASWLSGVRLVDAVTVDITDDDPLRLYRTFVTAVLLTRGVPE